MRYGPTHDLKKRGAMRIFRSKIGLALVFVLGLASAFAALAVAGIWTQNVVNDTNNVRLRIVHTYAGNFDSGWHTHPGLAIVQVTKGALQITQGSCTPKTVSAGDTSVEIPYVPVRAVGLGEIEWTTTFILAYGEAATTPVATSPCA